MKLTKKEIFSIPNIMGYFRIILIPVFCFMYIHAETKEEYFYAAVVVLISSLTDMFDGMVARKFNMITDLGKILDPVADKLTHGALALCVASKYPLMWILIAIMIFKEGYMGIMGLKYLRKGRMMNGAMWFGKICTATLFAGLLVLFLFPGLSRTVSGTLIVFMMAIMVATLFMYFRMYGRMKHEEGADEVKF